MNSWGSGLVAAYRPTWPDVAAALEGILALGAPDSAGAGPLGQTLERHMADRSGVRHAILAANPAIALTLAARAVGWSGSVVLSALAPPRCGQALAWAGLQPRFCDVDPTTFAPSPATVRAALRPDTAAILGLAGPDDPCEAMAALAAQRGLAFCRDDSFAAGPWERRRDAFALAPLPAHADAAGAACLLTHDGALASRLREIRNQPGNAVPETLAALALLQLQSQATAHGHAARLRSGYATGLDGVAGLRLVSHAGMAAAVLDGFGSSRDQVLDRLQRAGWAARRPLPLQPGAVRCHTAAWFTARAVLLPVGPAVTSAAVAALCRELRGSIPRRH